MRRRAPAAGAESAPTLPALPVAPSRAVPRAPVHLPAPELLRPTLEPLSPNWAVAVGADERPLLPARLHPILAPVLEAVTQALPGLGVLAQVVAETLAGLRVRLEELAQALRIETSGSPRLALLYRPRTLSAEAALALRAALHGTLILAAKLTAPCRAGLPGAGILPTAAILETCPRAALLPARALPPGGAIVRLGPLGLHQSAEGLRVLAKEFADAAAHFGILPHELAQALPRLGVMPQMLADSLSVEAGRVGVVGTVILPAASFAAGLHRRAAAPAAPSLSARVILLHLPAQVARQFPPRLGVLVEIPPQPLHVEAGAVPLAGTIRRCLSRLRGVIGGRGGLKGGGAALRRQHKRCRGGDEESLVHAHDAIS